LFYFTFILVLLQLCGALKGADSVIEQYRTAPLMFFE